MLCALKGSNSFPAAFLLLHDWHQDWRGWTTQEPATQAQDDREASHPKEEFNEAGMDLRLF